MRDSQLWMLLLALVLSSSSLAATRGFQGDGSSFKTSVFMSPPFILKPGSVGEKFYYDVPFPRGHIGLKSFFAEVVDDNGNPVPLYETYLHHWGLFRYYGEEGAVDDAGSSKIIFIRNSGPCGNVGQYVGIGSETRKTDTWVPDPYGIEIGNPAEIPQGYQERWLLNVHAIDTRGVEDRLGCTECKCSLYNVTVDARGRPLDDGYVGGLHCCYDQTQCRVKGGFNGSARKLYLRYTMKWAEWIPSMIPVEYTVPPCDSVGEANGKCLDVKRAKVVLPRGGDIVYGVAHQHTGGLGSAIFGEDGRPLCSSTPLYGNGEEPGNEAGYIVGMSTCYPKPGSVTIKDGELVTVVSNYNNAHMHTGVMGLFYILVAEPRPKLNTLLSQGLASPWFTELTGNWWVLAFAGLIMVVVVAAVFRKRNETEGYERVNG
ncbi:hypothetical protein KSP40_PGU011249 [Platanthera guangdongensis]|uniref:Uncharacterized protein n=1 Tax=Platanthera guangdongensis TaxID=2320717 RepID=A0ABR2MSQ8_9ASPA